MKGKTGTKHTATVGVKGFQKKSSLSYAQSDGARLLAEGLSKQKVSDKIGVSVSTIYKWLKQPAFITAIEIEKKHLNLLKPEYLKVESAEIKTRLDSLLLTSLNRLEKIIKESPNEPAVVKAAVFVIEKYAHNHTVVEEEIEKEMEELESAFRLVGAV